MAEWFVRWTTKLAIRVRFRLAAGLPTGYSGLGGNLTGYCCQRYRPRLDNRGGNGTHRGLCWKQVVPSIPGGDFRRLPTLNKRPLPFLFFNTYSRKITSFAKRIEVLPFTKLLSSLCSLMRRYMHFNSGVYSFWSLNR